MNERNGPSGMPPMYRDGDLPVRKGEAMFHALFLSKRQPPASHER